jgi:hypothetical protein
MLTGMTDTEPAGAGMRGGIRHQLGHRSGGRHVAVRPLAAVAGSALPGGSR